MNQEDQTLDAYRKRDQNRLDARVDDIAALTDPEDMMLELMDTLTDTEIAPTPGKFYTFIYTAQTPKMRYDQHPLIACLEVLPWGFRGLNYHWGEVRNYTWGELQSPLYIIYPMELSDARRIPYQYFLTK